MAEIYRAPQTPAQIEGDRLRAHRGSRVHLSGIRIAAKRGHDRNLPLWLFGIFFGAGALLDLFTVLGWAGTDVEPSLLSVVVAVPFTILGLGLFVELGFRKGT